MNQHSFTLNFARGTSLIQEIESFPFVHPQDCLSVVNQGGKIKLHALVDDNQPKVTHQVLIAGTGTHIDDSLMDRLYKIGTVLIDDAKYGYHVFYIGQPRHASAIDQSSEPVRTAAFSLIVQLKPDVESSDDLEDLLEELNDIAGSQPDDLRLVDDIRHNNTLRLEFFNTNYRNCREFSEVLTGLCSSRVTSSFSIVEGQA